MAGFGVKTVQDGRNQHAWGAAARVGIGFALSGATVGRSRRAGMEAAAR